MSLANCVCNRDHSAGRMSTNKHRKKIGATLSNSRPPKDSTDSSPDSSAHLARNLRQFRKQGGQTLDQLAEISGVSRAMISKIERGVSVPTATVLGRLAAAFKLSLSQLLGQAPYSREPRLVDRDEQSVFRDPKSGFERRSLFPRFADGTVDVAFNVLPARRAVTFPAHHLGVEEYLVVHEGILTVRIDNTPFVVAAGKSLFYPSDHVHEFVNETDSPATFYIVIDDRSKK